MNPQTTRRPLRAALAIYGARSARQHLARTGAITRQLDQIAPGTAEVHTVPVTIDDQPRTWAVLLNDLIQPVTTGHDARMAAVRLLRHMYPRADWSTPQRYDVRTGHLTPDTPTAPAALDINTAEVTR
ncbi:hypothetical protein OG520_22315 [Streptomyces sp. NBC_00984]|uniref:hypothetical protein n=1 Tax=Streptomyces sp. NBC_00984 TaxID=2903700 RepID=UPI003863472D|nr:hypothetical protein OG520_22315 [Streptomyces sp. NBC_00984]